MYRIQKYTIGKPCRPQARMRPMAYLKPDYESMEMIMQRHRGYVEMHEFKKKADEENK